MSERERLINLVVDHPELAGEIYKILLQAKQKTILADPFQESLE